MGTHVTVADVVAMKRRGQKIVGVVAWDYQLAQIADRAGVDLVSVGDSVGTNLWGRSNPLDVSMDEMVLVCQAVRRGVKRAIVMCDFPFGPLQEGRASAVRAAVRLVRDAGADMVKLDAAADFLDAVAAVSKAGIPVVAQFGITPQTALRHGIGYPQMSGPGSHVPLEMKEELVAQARQLEAAGATMLDFTNSGPAVGPAVVQSVSIPVIGGMGGGPWLDGRIRMIHAAIGYSAASVDNPSEGYANVGAIAFDALRAYSADVREGRQIKGGMAV